jgi:hypothetical protein
MLPLEQLALVGLEFALQPFSPLAHRPLVACGNGAEVASKARLRSFARGLGPASWYAFWHVVSTAHQSDQNHALAVQFGRPVLGLDSVIDVDVRRRLARLLWRPVSNSDAASKHQRVDILTQDRIHDALALQKRAFCFGLSRRKMYGISKLLQQLLSQEFGNRCNVRAGALIALERRFIGPVKYEDGVDGEGDEAEEAVIEGAQRGISATCRCQSIAVRKAFRRIPLLAWIWNSQMDVSIAMRSGRPVSSNFSTASLERATRFPGPISLYILRTLACTMQKLVERTRVCPSQVHTRALK